MQQKEALVQQKEALVEQKEALRSILLKSGGQVLTTGTWASQIAQMTEDRSLQLNVAPWWWSDAVVLPHLDPWAGVASLRPGSAESAVVQPRVTSVIKSLVNGSTPFVLVDAHKQVTFFDRRPDIIICPREWAPKASDAPMPPAWYIAAIGEVKGRRGSSEQFTNDELGKLLSFLTDLMRVRPDRPHAVGFLTDAELIQFMEIQRVADGGSFRARLTPVLKLRRDDPQQRRSGGDWLHALLCADLATLGLQQIAVAAKPCADDSAESIPVALSAYLGQGSSATVWSARWRDRDVVAKLFRATGDLEVEHKNLVVAQKLEGVTQLLGRGDRVLVLSPVGKSFVSPPSYSATNAPVLLPSASDFCRLVEIVRRAHDPKVVGLVHRDLSPSNFFLGPDGVSPPITMSSEPFFPPVSELCLQNIFLNDWGSAVQVNAECAFAGALTFAATRVLRAARDKIRMEGSLDLEMIVKVVFATLQPGYFDVHVPRLHSTSTPADLATAARVWDAIEALPAWAPLFNAAHSADYAQLQLLIHGLVPELEDPKSRPRCALHPSGARPAAPPPPP